VPSFEDTYDPGIMSELLDQAMSAKYLVLDLRGNPGGEVDKMRQFLGLLMPVDTPIGTFVSRRMANDYTKAEGEGSDPVQIAHWAHREFHPLKGDIGPFQGKIAVLVDGHSASAAEIVASTLSEELHSPIVGSPSMGAVLVSTFDRLSYGFQLQFPVGDYVSHGGHRLEGHPLKPDVTVSGLDAPEVALKRLKSGI
jgi:C-terminal processing protease CtpA/Prc